MSKPVVPSPSVPHAAQVLASAGLSLVPIADLRTKKPAHGAWKQFMSRRAGLVEVESWFIANGHPAAQGFGVVCGAVSGGLTVLDFDTLPDGSTLFARWAAVVASMDDQLVTRLPQVRTPSGGDHVYFLCDVVEGNTKLAEGANHETWIETRGEGGYVVAPPSPGYRTIAGSITRIPTITPEQRQLLLDVARSFHYRSPAAGRQASEQDKPVWESYNKQTSLLDVLDLLARHGWTEAGRGGDHALLRRPGKEDGTSATVRLLGDVPIFYCFSTNAHPIPAREGLSPFALYAYLEHGGDMAAAASALRPHTVPASNQVSILQGNKNEAQAWDWRQFVQPIAHLLRKEFAPINWLVDGVIPYGITLVAGNPKSGKSLFGWGLAVAIALGGVALGTVPVAQRDVLYLMFEDSERTTQKRLKGMLRGREDIERLSYSATWPRLGQGGEEALEQWYAAHPDGVVIIDTYENLRSAPIPGLDAYRNDYTALIPLRNKAKEQGWNAVVIHHTNKVRWQDALDAVNGSRGLSGSFDTLGILHRVRFGEEVTLTLSGRDLDQDMKLALAFDPLTHGHTLLGDADEVGSTKSRQEVVDMLRASLDPMTMRELATALGRPADDRLQDQLRRMADAGVIVRTDRGMYTLPKHPALPALPANGEAGACDPPTLFEGGAPAQPDPPPGHLPEVPEVPEEGAATVKERVKGHMLTVPCTRCGKTTYYWSAPVFGKAYFCAACWHAMGPKQREKHAASQR